MASGGGDRSIDIILYLLLLVIAFHSACNHLFIAMERIKPINRSRSQDREEAPDSSDIFVRLLPQTAENGLRLRSLRSFSLRRL